MNYYVFADRECIGREIKAKTLKGALLKARAMFGIKVGLRKVYESGNLVEYRSSETGYRCQIEVL